MEPRRERADAPDENIRALYARLDDLCAQAGQGVAAVTPFLTPREAKYARQYLSGRLRAGLALLWGGYPDAERVRAFLLPDYLEGLLPTVGADGGGSLPPADLLRAAGFDDLAEDAAEQTAALSVRGSGFRTLTHRDYMGAVLGTGLERDAVGDILSADGQSALLFCDRRVAEFLCANMSKVGSDTVRLHIEAPDGIRVPPRATVPVQDTVASGRLDCVVAALCGLPRERAQSAVREGLCELEYECVRDCDRTVEPPAVLSVRGYGKFRVLSFDGENRRGRIRLIAEKFTG